MPDFYRAHIQDNVINSLIKTKITFVARTQIIQYCDDHVQEFVLSITDYHYYFKPHDH
jgi:hypothetical protein